MWSMGLSPMVSLEFQLLSKAIPDNTDTQKLQEELKQLEHQEVKLQLKLREMEDSNPKTNKDRDGILYTLAMIDIADKSFDATFKETIDALETTLKSARLIEVRFKKLQKKWKTNINQALEATDVPKDGSVEDNDTLRKSLEEVKKRVAGEIE